MDKLKELITDLEKVKESLVSSEFTHAKSLDVDRIDLVIDWLKERQNDHP